MRRCGQNITDGTKREKGRINEGETKKETKEKKWKEEK